MRPDDTVYLGHYDYSGAVGEVYFVVCDGSELKPQRSQRVVNHSPDGFAWGYGGSGPLQLSVALLLDFTGVPALAAWHAYDFLRDVVSRWPQEDGWTLWGGEVHAWLDAAQARNPFNAKGAM